MKQKFSTKWMASSQPRKQRKFLINAPLHIKRKFLSATLTKELRKKHSRRSIEVRKGDEVEVMRGKFDGKKGKITEINIKKLRVAVEGIQATKRDGTKVNVWFSPSKLKITTLNTDDKKRIKNKQAVSETKQKETKEIKHAPEKK
jgi:large subunit ribosomal protein L24